MVEPFSATSPAIPGDRRNLRVAVSALLSAKTNGRTAWYLLADPEVCDTLDVGLLVGAETP